MITLLPPRNQTPFKAIKLLLTGQLFSRVMARSTSLTKLKPSSWRVMVGLEMPPRASVRRMPGVGDFDTASRDNSMQMVEFNVSIGAEKVRVKRTDNAIVVAGVEVPIDELAPQVRRELSIATARLDGASFDIDVAAVDVQEARAAISAAIVAVMGDRAFHDRLIVATRRAASAN